MKKFVASCDIAATNLNRVSGGKMNRIFLGFLSGLMLMSSPLQAEERKKGGTVTGPVIAKYID